MYRALMCPLLTYTFILFLSNILPFQKCNFAHVISHISKYALEIQSQKLVTFIILTDILNQGISSDG